MRIIGNVLWIIFGGLEACILWFFIGLVYYITIIGIPFGKQAFKMAKLSLLPFGKEIKRDKKGAGRFIGNVIWFILGGLILTLCHFIFGIVFCVTIIGIPFGLQNFKLAKLALSPFGLKIS